MFCIRVQNKIKSLLMALILGFCSGMLNHHSQLRWNNSQRGKHGFLHPDHKNSVFCTQVHSKMLPGAKFAKVTPCHILHKKRQVD